MTTQDLQGTTILLARTPAALNTLLRGLPDTWTQCNEGAGTWSVHEIVAHLVHTERTNWLPRMRQILQYGESKPFEPLDRAGFAKDGPGPLDALLDEFIRLRGDNLKQLEALGLSVADFNRRGRHPALGTVTLAQLLSTWVSHDLTHLHQISRVMARQYEQAVGPWHRFLGVLRCEGHSTPA